MLRVFWYICGLIQRFLMSQSNLYIDIGNSAIKWRTSDSKVFSEDIENFSITALNPSNVAWLSAVAHSDIVQEISTYFETFNIIKPYKRFGNLTLSYDDPSMIGVDRFLAMLGATYANVLVGILSAIVDNIPVMFAVLTMTPDMSLGQWLLVTLTAGVGGSLLSIGSAAGVALMGQSKGYYTFVSHLKWIWAIALGYAASILVHLWINSALFDVPI